MKKHYLLLILILIVAGTIFWSGTFNGTPADYYTNNFITGKPAFQSIGELTFGPEGILFFSDSPGAAIYAIDTGDKVQKRTGKVVNVNNIEAKIAQKMGVAPDNISFNDMAANPISQNIYLSVARGNGNNVSYHLVRISPDGSITEYPLSKIKYSKFELNTAPAPDAKDRRGRSLRTSTITDISYSGDHLFVAGLSNEEFASGFRQIDFPFRGKESLSTLEIYHVSHGQFETNAPVRSFTFYASEAGNFIVAGYTCTPLVIFPLDNLKDGQHVKGKTVAELGNRNTPLDILSYKNSQGKPSIIIANNSRATMRVNPMDFEEQPSLEQPMNDDQETAGVAFETLPYKNILQLDNLNENYLVMLQRDDDGSVNIHSISK